MPTFEARVRTTHDEVWWVEADDESAARKKIEDLTDDVETDETFGEVVDWDIKSIKIVKKGAT